MNAEEMADFLIEAATAAGIPGTEFVRNRQQLVDSMTSDVLILEFFNQVVAKANDKLKAEHQREIDDLALEHRASLERIEYLESTELEEPDHG